MPADPVGDLLGLVLIVGLVLVFGGIGVWILFEWLGEKGFKFTFLSRKVEKDCYGNQIKKEINMSTFFKFVGVVIAIVVALLVISTAIVVVPAGTVGVKDTFGVVDSTVLPSGIHLKNPFTHVVVMSYQTQKYYDLGSVGEPDVATIDGLSNEGLVVTMGIAVNYHIESSKAPDIYRTIGLDYINVIMKQPVHSVPRDIISKYDVKTLYSAGASAENPDRARIEQELFNGISSGVLANDGTSRGIVVERVFLRNIKLPQTLMDAIEQKLKMEQQIAQKGFEVSVAQKEADRKVAEAQGIANANKIIAGSLTDSYLKWYWLENQKENPNVIYMLPSDSPFPFTLTKDTDSPNAVKV